MVERVDAAWWNAGATHLTRRRSLATQRNLITSGLVLPFGKVSGLGIRDREGVKLTTCYTRNMPPADRGVSVVMLMAE